MRLHYDATGHLLHGLYREPPETPPAGTAGHIDIDETTNAALFEEVREHWTERFRVVGGQLQRGGQPVTIAGPSPEQQADAAERAWLDGLLAATTNTISAGDLRRALRYIRKHAGA